MTHTEGTDMMDTEQKGFWQTSVQADQAHLYERDGWEIVGYRGQVADIRKRLPPYCVQK